MFVLITLCQWHINFELLILSRIAKWLFYTLLIYDNFEDFMGIYCLLVLLDFVVPPLWHIFCKIMPYMYIKKIINSKKQALFAIYMVKLSYPMVIVWRTSSYLLITIEFIKCCWHMLQGSGNTPHNPFHSSITIGA